MEATDASIQRIPMGHARIKDPWTCPARFLPWLAWELSLDTWDSDWPVQVKRQRIASAITIQRHKGTAGSVRDVVASFGGEIVIREWWEQSPRSRPHTFELVMTLSDTGAVPRTAEYVEAIITEVERTKPVRSHFTFTLGASFEQSLGAVGAVRPLTYRRLQARTGP